MRWQRLIGVVWGLTPLAGHATDRQGDFHTCPIPPALLQEIQKPAEGCPNPKGWKPSEIELTKILADHLVWLETLKLSRGSSVNEWADAHPARRANLCNADLTERKLPGVNLAWSKINSAILLNADLAGATLEWAELNHSNLILADLSAAKLANAKLNGSLLNVAKLGRAKLSGAQLTGTSLWRTNLEGADLQGADLTRSAIDETSLAGTMLANTLVTDACFAPRSEPPNSYVAGIKDLQTVSFPSGREDGLVQLRALLQKAGLSTLEREATFAIESGKTKYAIAAWRSDLSAAIAGVFQRVVFDWTTRYGLEPGRALMSIMVIWCLLTPLYALAVSSRVPRDSSGIFRIWPKERLNFDQRGPKLEPSAEVERVRARGLQVLGWAAYFSLLSSFQIGYKEFSIGTWLTRAQPQNFVLEATGWVRTIAGIQSLVSMYLLAMWLLTYFGRPFQ
jgi:hypothetical protein